MTLLRRPQRLGELEGAGAGGHHEGHAEPAQRRSIVKDPKTGEPTGHLRNPRPRLVDKVQPPQTDADRRAAIAAAVAHAHQFGVTSIQNAGGSIEEMALYEQAQRAGELQVRGYLACRPRPHDRGRLSTAWRDLQAAGQRPDADDRQRQDVRGRSDREPHGGDACAVREQQERPARRTCRPSN